MDSLMQSYAQALEEAEQYMKTACTEFDAGTHRFARPPPVVDVRVMHPHVTSRSKSRFAMMHRSAVWPHWQAASEQPCQTLFDVAPSINDGKYRDRAVSRDIESKVVLCLCLSEHTPIRKRRQNPVPQRKPFKPAYCFQI